MSGEFDSRENFKSAKFDQRSHIFVKLSFRGLRNSNLSSLHSFDNMIIIHLVEIG